MRALGDVGGNTAVMFALVLPIILMSAGMGIDYARAVYYRTRLQQAADSAVLAAASAARNGVEQSAVEELAQRAFEVNLAQSLGSSGLPSVSVSVAGTTVTATLTVQGQTPTSLTRIFDNEKLGMTVVAKAVAEIGPTTSTTVGGNLNGAGAVYGDPYFYLYDQTHNYIWCAHGKWYAALSDGGFQWNTQCHQFTGLGGAIYNSQKLFVGGHVITFEAVPETSANYEADVFADDVAPSLTVPVGTAWPSKLTIDGAVVAYDSSMPVTREVLSDAASGVRVSVTGSLHAVPAAFDPVPADHYNFVALIIETAHYKIVMTHYKGFAVADITATNAGMCGVPGGIWGQLLGTAALDTDEKHFEIPGPDELYPQHSWIPTCGSVGSGSTARLVE